VFCTNKTRGGGGGDDDDRPTDRYDDNGSPRAVAWNPTVVKKTALAGGRSVSYREQDGIYVFQPNKMLSSEHPIVSADATFGGTLDMFTQSLRKSPAARSRKHTRSVFYVWSLVGGVFYFMFL